MVHTKNRPSEQKTTRFQYLKILTRGRTMLTFSHDSDLQPGEPGCLHHLADSLKDELVSPHVVVKS